MRKQMISGVLCLGLSVALYAQSVLTNEDVVKLAKSGLSEEFIVNLIQQQPTTQFVTEPLRLAEMKGAGVSEGILAAVVKKHPPKEPMDNEGLVRLVRAGFSEKFILDLLDRQPAGSRVDTSQIIELKKAGVSERILAALVSKGPRVEIPAGSRIVVRMIDEIDSEVSKEGDEFQASLDEPIVVGSEEVAPKGADARVKLAAEKESGRLTGKAELTVALASVKIRGKDVAVNTISVTQESSSRTAGTAKRAAAVGAIGAVIGAIAGGGKGAAIGAGAGAAAGAGSQVFTKGQRVRIPSETVLTFTTEGPLVIQ